ncbi:MAG TPA: hypothetical protein VIL46_05165 [Gemmataceae bacterium]
MNRSSLKYVLGLTLLLGLTGAASPARAGWYTLRNDTSDVLLVQEVVKVQGEERRVNPKRLFPGEQAREILLRPAVKHVLIFDAGSMPRPLYEGRLNCGAGCSLFSIRPAGPGCVAVVPVPPRSEESGRGR